MVRTIKWVNFVGIFKVPDPQTRDANLSSKFLSGQLDNFLALSGHCPDKFKYEINTINKLILTTLINNYIIIMKITLLG